MKTIIYPPTREIGMLSADDLHSKEQVLKKPSVHIIDEVKSGKKIRPS